MIDTICGVPVNAFKHDPSPSELGRIVGHMSIKEQASFLMWLAEQINESTAYIHRVERIAMLAETLVASETAECHGAASLFITELAKAIEKEANQ